MSDGFKWGAVVVALFAFIIGLSFATGKAQAVYNRTVGVEVSSSETDMFHKSKGFTEAMAQDLAKNKLELTKTTDETARGAIIDYLNTTYASFDVNDLNDKSLRQFLTDIKNGTIK